MRTHYTILFLFCACRLVSQSAIGQLETLTNTKINRYYSNSDDYYSSPPAPMKDQAYYDRSYEELLATQANDENERGIKAYNSKNWKKAAHYFSRAYKLNPNNAVYRQNLENARTMQKREEEFEKEKEKYETIAKNFVSTLNDDIKTHSGFVKKQRKQLASYVPPLGTPTRTVEEGLMLGLFNVQSDYAFANLVSPTGRKFKDGEFYATSDNKSMMELVRGVADNMFLGKYTLQTEWGKELVARINGTHFQRMFAHSNGATVTEALIRENIITVDELHIMGGDRSYMNFQAYNDLVTSGKVKKIVVWYNPGDIIPKGSSVKLIHPETAFHSEYERLFDDVSKNKHVSSQDGKIQYRKLEGPQYKGQSYKFDSSFFEAHDLKTYFYNISIYLKNNPI